MTTDTTTTTPQKETWLTSQIDPQTRAELERAYMVVRVTENRLNECHGKKNQPRTLIRRYIGAIRQFQFLVDQAKTSPQVLNRAA